MAQPHVDIPSKNGKAPTSGSGKRSKYTPRQVIGEVSWDASNPTLLTATVSALVEDGCAALFGRSRDGGTLVLTVCDGDERIKYYAASSQEMDGHLAGIFETATGHSWTE